MLERFTAIALAAVPLMATAQVNAPRFYPDEIWTYRALNGWNQRQDIGRMERVVRRVEPGAIEFALTWPDKAADRMVLADPAFLRSGPLKRSLTAELDPPLEVLPYPLVEGKTWTQTVTRIDPATGTPRVVSLKGRIRGWETVRVPAGEFQALRIDRELYLGDAIRSRSDTWRVEREWYVPELKGAARLEIWEQHRDPAVPRVLQYMLINRELYELETTNARP